MNKKVLCVVNNDSPTSIPLEVAQEIKGKLSNLKVVVYYKTENSTLLRNSFIKEFKSINALGPLDIKGWIKVYKTIKVEKPKIIHAHHTISALVFFIICKLISSSTKLIKTVHNSRYSQTWYQRILNFIIHSLADEILCNSQSTLDSFSTLEKYFFEEKSRVSYNGVNLKKIKEACPNSGINKSNDSILIGSVGRLVKVKNYQTLIKAFEKVLNYCDSNLQLLLVGDGKQREELEEFCKKRNLDQHVIFTGIVERKAVYTLLKQLDIFVMPSLSEGFCNTLVEAMAAGKAIVCSDIKVFREIAGDTAKYASTQDHDEFSKNIQELITDPKQRSNLEEKAFKRAQKFSLEAAASRYVEAYK